MKKYDIVQLMAREGVINAIKRYGLEGTEQKIKSVYKYSAKLRDYMLKEYYKIIKGDIK